ncbi:membrane protein insertion efficiency factor YidD [Candidatus Roizmanbacteria bacterium RIFCSPHIGHO2_02_FULL_40_13b]|uniref:Putative membrane protein insertion efficiency factor n=1 Tax=Candidatus Roizmanbacteria bacterium RIFCSPHIGHO2_01_FULL_39_24 TaxID=1802032 RepID=A0A1F7GL69_9BACT|nr:MAG: membrane protein insertion efficiency factor YidD [Candidatus Roizmanbacteria bacterium RIFCSPHIGHO2_01_FULL_39_24]OGK27979.1 MAG: membrane protein insertion efficiency factor YidD [Candidatus Roizmanbacteria bacterium RIFCSPHIGHO2_02_FULL_40_13b]OGK49229.1 MAG: membrane protein insertion efficiency factor YidD [Candidatus Roizmanbacteria bacterium RIFCSPLOWO2_01_FULL_40_32]OGK57199.1 MAG: membrane protein insertion efficiency factor YidD [Candidatus Roizmanbacteria bacterium RIFCSPLOWO2
MKKPVLFAIKVYQRFHIFDNPISRMFFGANVCRFTPKCSDYSYQAIEKYGVIKGGKIALIRIARCNPRSPGGPDPVI